MLVVDLAYSPWEGLIFHSTLHGSTDILWYRLDVVERLLKKGERRRGQALRTAVTSFLFLSGTSIRIYNGHGHQQRPKHFWSEKIDSSTMPSKTSHTVLAYKLNLVSLVAISSLRSDCSHRLDISWPYDRLCSQPMRILFTLLT